MSNIFILFEGPDGAGKTTHIERAEIFLKEQGVNVIRTREPGSPHIETNWILRKLIKEDETLSEIDRELLFMADGYRHKRWIKEVLETHTDTVILCDRGQYSHFIYQRATQHIGRLDDDQLKKLVKLVEWYTYVPQYTIIFDIGFEAAKQRMGKRGKVDMIERMGEDFLRYVNKSYKQIETSPTVFRIDATGDRDAVFGRVKHIITEIRSSER